MFSSHGSQVAAFLQRQESVQVSQQDPDAPRVVFRTALELTRTQEDRLVNHYRIRKSEVSDELGREQVKGKSWWQNVTWSTDSSNTVKFLAKRMLMELVYNQQLDWRPYVMGGIYELGQNVHLPRCRQIVQQMVARGINYFFGTEPYYSVQPMPGKGINSTASDQVDEYSKWKFNQAKIRATFEQAVQDAFVRGEGLIKTRHWTDAIRYETFAMVAVAGPKGQPFLAHDGDYIYGPSGFDAGDRWVMRPQMTNEQKQEADMLAQTNNVPPDYSQFPQAMTLERDPQTAMPGPEYLQDGELIFERRKVMRNVVRYAGPQAVIPYPDDFLCPLNAPDLQQADILIHEYGIQALQIWQMYQDRLKAQGMVDEESDELARVLQILRTAPETGKSTLAAMQPRPELREGGSAATSGDPMIKINEVYMTFDVNQDGFAEEVFMLIDENDNPIIYDHLPNVFPDSKRPFHAVIINPVKGRWHGIGMMEVFWELQKFIDLMLNRWEFSQSKAGKVIFWHPELTVEGEANPSLQLNSGVTYRKKNLDTKAEQILEQVDLHEFKGDALKELLELANQMMVSLSATPSINDAALAGLDSTKLATGIRAIQRTAAEGFAPFLASMEWGLQSALEALLSLLLWYGDKVEEYYVLQSGKQTPMEIDTVDARNIQYSVTMELTRYRNAQQVSEAQAARACVLNFYGLPLALQVIVLPLYEEELKGYMIANPSAYIKIDPTGQLSSMQLPGAPGGSPALPSPGSGAPPPPDPLTSPS